MKMKRIYLKIDRNIDSLIVAAKNGLNQFCQQASIAFPAISKDINEKIEKMIPWRNFLYEILAESIMNENFNVDLSSLISSLSGHLTNIKKIEKHLQEKEEKEKEINAYVDNIKSIYEKGVKELEEKERKNLISKEQKERELEELKKIYELQENLNNNFNFLLNQINEQIKKEQKIVDEKLKGMKECPTKTMTEIAILQQELQNEKERRREAERIYREEERRYRERETSERRHQEEMERAKKNNSEFCLIQ